MIISVIILLSFFILREYREETQPKFPDELAGPQVISNQELI